MSGRTSLHHGAGGHAPASPGRSAATRGLTLASLLIIAAAFVASVVASDSPTPIPATGDVVQGWRLARACLGCHSLDGSTEFGPTWEGLYGSNVPLQDGSTVRADDAYLAESIRDPGAKIRAGFPPTMPDDPTLTDQDVADLIAVIRHFGGTPVPATPIRVEATPAGPGSDRSGSGPDPDGETDGRP